MAFTPALIAKALDDESTEDEFTSCPRCGFVGPPAAVLRHRKRAGHEAAGPEDETHGEDEAEMSIVSKATRAEHRYTFSPIYSPGLLDAHGEFTDAEELQKAVWDFDYRTPLRRQHGNERIGRIVEMVSWPYETEVDLAQPDGSIRKQKLPAGTVYAGVVWNADAWDDVKAGKITGLSMGGTAVRVRGVPLP